MANELKHVAIITDGNGRWATQRGLPRSKGHDEGLNSFWNITRWAIEKGIPYLTYYVMSLDNLKREKAEVDHIFDLARQIYSGGGVEKCKELGVRLIIAGDRSKGSEQDQIDMAKGEAATAECDKIICVLCAAYGGRDEIVRAANQCIADGVEITEESLSAHMYAAPFGVPDPDLIIRTGGYSRLSGFLPWQAVYTELYITPTLFPDLSHEEFLWACKWFDGIHRTHGGDRIPAQPTEATNAKTVKNWKTKGAPFAKKGETNGTAEKEAQE